MVQTVLLKRRIQRRRDLCFSIALLCAVRGNLSAQPKKVPDLAETVAPTDEVRDPRSEIHEEHEVSKGDVSLGGIFTLVGRSGRYLSGPGLQLSFSKDVKEKFGLGLRIYQSYSVADRFAAFMTGVSIESSWTLVGNTRRKATRVFIDDRSQVVEIKDLVPGSIMLIAQFQQTFINSVNQVYPYSGPAVGIIGSLPSSENDFLSLGGKLGMLTNGVTTLLNLELSLSWKTDI